MVGRPLGGVYREHRLQHLHELRRIVLGGSVHKTGEVGLEEQSLVEVVAIDRFFKECGLQQGHAHAEHALLDEAQLAVHSAEISQLFRSVENAGSEGVPVGVVDHVVVQDFEQALGSDEHEGGGEAQRRLQLSEAQVARLQDAPQLVLVEPLLLLQPRSDLVLQSHLRVLVEREHFVRGRAQPVEAMRSHFRHRQDVLRLILCLALEPRALPLENGLRCVGVLPEQEGELGLRLLQNEAQLVAAQLLVIREDVAGRFLGS